MVMLVLALILVICSQVSKPMTITVPHGFNGIPGKCDFALAEKHKLKEPLLAKGTIQHCADACRKSADCASFHFTGQFGGNEGECVYSSFICIDNSLISQAMDDKTFRVYITKGTLAWTESARPDPMFIRRLGQPGETWYTEGCCEIDKEVFCAHDKGEAEEAGSEIASTGQCYAACMGDPACASYRIKWTVPSELHNETGTCFTSRHACSFTANNQNKRVDEERSEATTYVLVQRLKSNRMTAGGKKIDVGGVSI